MVQTVPYIICHLQVEDQIEKINLSLLNEAGYYCVFWYRSIALGHIYIERNDGLNDLDYQRRVIAAVEPTLRSYLLKNNLYERYKEEFLAKSSLLQLIKAACSAYVTEVFPQKVSVSVVICTRNRCKSLQKCLESLYQQTCMPEEIIVVDNAPVDDTTRKVVEQFPDVIYCKESRPGLDIARNRGAMVASCSVIAYTDDDVQVHKLWTYRIWETFFDKSIHAVTGLIISSSLDTESQQIFEKYWGFNKGYQDITFGKDFLSVMAPRVWEIGAGANMAFRKHILEEAGFFDERLDVGAAGCSGDSEIWYRILDANYVIQYTPRAIVYHEHRNQFSALKKQLFSYMRGHAAAALIQHAHNNEHGYKKYIYYYLLKNYFNSLRAGFPTYPSRYKTIFTEIKGVISGIKFFYKNRKRPKITY